MMNNGRPLSVRKKVRLLVALTILAWATQTLFHQWGFGQTLPSAETIAPERFIPALQRGGPGSTLELRGEATVIGAEVKLRSICRWSDADVKVFAPIADLVMMRLADKRPFRAIDVDEIKQTLHDAGVSLANIKFAGATACTVSRSDVELDERTALQQWIDARNGKTPAETASIPPAATPAVSTTSQPAPAFSLQAKAEPATATFVSSVAPQAPTTSAAVPVDGPGVRTLREILIADVADRLGLAADTLQMRFAPKDEKVLNLSQPIFRFEVTPQRVRNLGDVAWDVVIVTETGTQKVSIAANARAWQKQLVVTKPLSMKQTIQEDDVTDRRALIDRLPDETLLTRDQVVGQMASRDIRVGSIMTSRLVEPVPLVQPGQFVTIILSGNNMQIKTVAKALERGCFGQTVRVRNETTKDVLEVVMIGPQIARIGAADAVAAVDRN